jgi:hypothetical protein
VTSLSLQYRRRRYFLELTVPALEFLVSGCKQHGSWNSVVDSGVMAAIQPLGALLLLQHGATNQA